MPARENTFQQQPYWRITVLKPTLYSMALIALLAACSKNEQAPPAASTSAPAPAAAPAPAPAPAAPAAAEASAATPAVASAGGDTDKGEKTYKTTCAICHATGTAGAPTFGSKADWDPRIAQGKDTLYTHALKGFTGTKGTMPPKGGNASLPDDDVKAAVDYMVSKAK
jgi:cytochrome c5